MTEAGAVLHSRSPAATEAFGSALGAVMRHGDVLILDGPLGAGKTCLVRGIVGGAGGNATAVRSPTFVIHQPHEGLVVTVHHIDLYRLGPAAGIEVLDLDTALIDGAAVIEWGGYADLTGFAPFTVSISSDGEHDDHRVLRLSVPAPPHIARAWEALLAQEAGT